LVVILNSIGVWIDGDDARLPTLTLR
jgi:hypothetical protein